MLLGRGDVLLPAVGADESQSLGLVPGQVQAEEAQRKDLPVRIDLVGIVVRGAIRAGRKNASGVVSAARQAAVSPARKMLAIASCLAACIVALPFLWTRAAVGRQ